MGDAVLDPSTPMPLIVSNLSMGRAILNVYTAAYPEPQTPMGCCNNAEVRPVPSIQIREQYIALARLGVGVYIAAGFASWARHFNPCSGLVLHQ